MGICDIIPGISGGTIAFITGIYSKLIKEIKTFFSAQIKKTDFFFLITLFSGIIIALIAGSRLMTYLLNNFFIYTISFFIGLIIASSVVIFKNIKNHNPKNILFGIFGLVIGLALAFLIPATTAPTPTNILLGGFLAVSAMFLPGISGAFILLILGLYEFMLKVLHDIPGNILPLVLFIIGAILGAIVISRVISFLFKKDKCKTLYVLLGLVIGALSIPIKKIIESDTTWTTSKLVIMIIIFLVGIALVIFITRSEKTKK